MSFILVNITQRLHRFFIIIAVFVFIVGCTRKAGEESRSGSNTNKTTALSGEALAKKHCASCHAFPDPQLLDKATWRYGVLPQMGYRMGIYEDTTRQSLIENGPGGVLVEKQGVFPQNSIVNEKEWELIKDYYVSMAPDRLTMPEKDMQMEIQGLQVEIPEFHIDPPMITLVKYSPGLDQIFVADAKADYSTY